MLKYSSCWRACLRKAPKSWNNGVVKLLRLLFFSTLFAASLFAADLTGTWTGVVKLGNGNELPFIVHMKQQGETITGKMDGIGGAPDVEIQSGKISGDTVTYVGIRKINSVDVKFTYTATLTGEKLDFKILRADGSGMPLASSTTRLSTTN